MANDFSGDANCVALYKFESGALTTDSEGGNTLTNNNTVTEDAVNYKEGACSADFESGNNEYFNITDANLDAGFPLKNGDTTKIISVCGWIRPESDPGAMGIFAKWNYTNNKRSLAIIIEAGNAIQIWNGYNSGASYETKTHGSSLTLDAAHWYHIGAVHDGVNKTIFVKIWDDTAGSQLGSNIDTTWTNETNVEDADLQIGSLEDANYTFDGLMDEVVVFKDKLTEAEIDQIRAGTYGAAGGVAPTGALYGPLFGPLGGPI